MARSGVSLDWGGFDRAMGDFSRRMERQRNALMAEIGEALVSGTIKRFDEEESPEGAAWTSSDRATSEGGKTLQDTGHLRNSLDCAITPDNVMVGSNVVYARIHQLGGIIKPTKGKRLKFTAGGKDVFAREVTIPARPYLGVSKADMDEVRAVIAGFLAEPFGGGRS